MGGTDGSELIELEKAYWGAMRDADAARMSELTDFPCLIVGAQGVASVDRTHLAAMMEAATWRLESFTLGEGIELRFLTDDVAILAYNVSEALTVEGRKLTLDAADASVWVRRDGTWRCALHTESIAGDPFGRG